MPKTQNPEPQNPKSQKPNSKPKAQVFFYQLGDELYTAVLNPKTLNPKP
jgi:hypothetical protein